MLRKLQQQTSPPTEAARGRSRASSTRRGSVVSHPSSGTTVTTSSEVVLSTTTHRIEASPPHTPAPLLLETARPVPTIRKTARRRSCKQRSSPDSPAASVSTSPLSPHASFTFANAAVKRREPLWPRKRGRYPPGPRSVSLPTVREAGDTLVLGGRVGSAPAGSVADLFLSEVEPSVNLGLRRDSWRPTILNEVDLISQPVSERDWMTREPSLGVVMTFKAEPTRPSVSSFNDASSLSVRQYQSSQMASTAAQLQNLLSAHPEISVPIPLPPVVDSLLQKPPSKPSSLDRVALTRRDSESPTSAESAKSRASSFSPTLLRRAKDRRLMKRVNLPVPHRASMPVTSLPLVKAPLSGPDAKPVVVQSSAVQSTTSSPGPSPPVLLASPPVFSLRLPSTAAPKASPHRSPKIDGNPNKFAARQGPLGNRVGGGGAAKEAHQRLSSSPELGVSSTIPEHRPRHLELLNTNSQGSSSKKSHSTVAKRPRNLTDPPESQHESVTRSTQATALLKSRHEGSSRPASAHYHDVTPPEDEPGSKPGHLLSSFQHGNRYFHTFPPDTMYTPEGPSIASIHGKFDARKESYEAVPWSNFHPPSPTRIPPIAAPARSTSAVHETQSYYPARPGLGKRQGSSMFSLFRKTAFGESVFGAREQSRSRGFSASKPGRLRDTMQLGAVSPGSTLIPVLRGSDIADRRSRLMKAFQSQRRIRRPLLPTPLPSNRTPTPDITLSHHDDQLTAVPEPDLLHPTTARDINEAPSGRPHQYHRIASARLPPYFAQPLRLYSGRGHSEHESGLDSSHGAGIATSTSNGDTSVFPKSPSGLKLASTNIPQPLLRLEPVSRESNANGDENRSTDSFGESGRPKGPLYVQRHDPRRRHDHHLSSSEQLSPAALPTIKSTRIVTPLEEMHNEIKTKDFGRQEATGQTSEAEKVQNGSRRKSTVQWVSSSSSRDTPDSRRPSLVEHPFPGHIPTRSRQSRGRKRIRSKALSLLSKRRGRQYPDKNGMPRETPKAPDNTQIYAQSCDSDRKTSPAIVEEGSYLRDKNEPVGQPVLHRPLGSKRSRGLLPALLLRAHKSLPSILIRGSRDISGLGDEQDQQSARPRASSLPVNRSGSASAQPLRNQVSLISLRSLKSRYSRLSMWCGRSRGVVDPQKIIQGTTEYEANELNSRKSSTTPQPGGSIQSTTSAIGSNAYLPVITPADLIVTEFYQTPYTKRYHDTARTAAQERRLFIEELLTPDLSPIIGKESTRTQTHTNKRSKVLLHHAIQEDDAEPTRVKLRDPSLDGNSLRISGSSAKQMNDARRNTAFGRNLDLDSDSEDDEDVWLDSEEDVPDHLPSSPLCPAHPRNHRTARRGICMVHGRARQRRLQSRRQQRGPHHQLRAQRKGKPKPRNHSHIASKPISCPEMQSRAYGNSVDGGDSPRYGRESDESTSTVIRLPCVMMPSNIERSHDGAECPHLRHDSWDEGSSEEDWVRLSRLPDLRQRPPRSLSVTSCCGQVNTYWVMQALDPRARR